MNSGTPGAAGFGSETGAAFRHVDSVKYGPTGAGWSSQAECFHRVQPIPVETVIV